VEVELVVVLLLLEELLDVCHL
jgi:hypothetical protein